MSKENLESQVIDKLKERFPIEEDLSFNEFTIKDKLEKHSYVLMKYNHQYINATAKLSKLQETHEQLIGEKYDYYRFHFDENLSKSEIEKYYLPKDPDILKYKQAVRIQIIVVDFFKTCVDEIERLQWNMKNYLDLTKRGI